MSATPSPASRSQRWKVLDPVTTGNQAVKELQAQADIIILLAAMPVEELRALLTQLPGVTIAVAGGAPGGLIRPLQVGRTIVVCSPGFGKYLGMLRLSLKDPKAPFVDEARITELGRALAVAERRIREGASGSFEEKKKMEAELQELKEGNIYHNELIALSSNVQEERGMKRFIEDFRSKKGELGKGCK